MAFSDAWHVTGIRRVRRRQIREMKNDGKHLSGKQKISTIGISPE